MQINYQALVPYPYYYVSNFQIGFDNTDLTSLKSSLDSQDTQTNSDFINNYQTDGNDNQISYFVNRSDNTQQVSYTNFTPDSQTVVIEQYNTYSSVDGTPFMDCVTSQNPYVDYNAHPEWLPEQCTTIILVEDYAYPIDTSLPTN